MNMRKIIAVLAAVLMLCTIIPMGAMSVAADGDVIIDYNFDDGIAHFERGYVENGYMVFDGTTAPWQNCYLYANAMKANTDYVVTFKAKADKDASMSVKINNNWAGDTAEVPVSVTTEWQDFEVMINTGDLTSTALVMFYSPYPAESAPIFCIDDLKIVEYVEPVAPGTVINGDFETGDLSGWASHQGTVISTDAHSGSYAANIKGDGGWGGMLNQDVPVEAGKPYKISIWVKANANGANVQIQDGPNGTQAYLASQWFTATEWTELVWEVIPTTNVICLNFCGGGNNIAEDVLVDDITITEKVYGQVINGDFSNGSEGWNLSGYASVVDGAIQLDNPTQWDEALTQIVEVEPNTTYEITWKSKRISGTGPFNLIPCQTVSPWANFTKVDGQNWMTETSGEWVANSYTVNSGDNTAMLLKFTTEAASNPGVILLDDVIVSKVVEPEQPENAVIWNIDFNDGDKKFNVGEVVAEGPDGSNCYKWEFGGGWSSNYTSGPRMDFTKDYTVTMKVKGSIDSSMAITLMPGDWSTWWNGPSFTVTTEWQEVVLAIPANTVTFASGNTVFEFQGTGSESAYTLYVDDIAISEGLPPAPSNLLQNGDFETGKVAPWDNLWGSCPTVEIVEGMDGSYGLHIVSGEWKHVRQTAIAVNANTWYKVTAWAKDTKGMSLLVKDGGDSKDLKNVGVEAGEEWTEFTFEFNTGDYNSIIFSLMGNNAEEAYGTFDNIVMEVAPCQHEYEYECSTTCSLCGKEREAACVSDSEPCMDGLCIYCGNDVLPTAEHSYFYPCDIVCQVCYQETNPDATHNVQHVEALEPTCTALGNVEYWYCADCGAAWLDADCTQVANQMSVKLPMVDHEYFYACDAHCMNCGEETNPDAAHNVIHVEAKAAVSCIEYGNKEYWYCDACGAAWLDANLIRQTNLMSVRIAGECVSDAEYACQDGTCVNCGLPYAADAEHEYDDEYDADCNVCGDVREVPERPVEIIYGDANGDGVIDTLDEVLLSQYLAEWDVELNEAAADANGDGIIDTLDEVLLSQYLAEWEVTLGPV